MSMKSVVLIYVVKKNCCEINEEHCSVYLTKELITLGYEVEKCLITYEDEESVAVQLDLLYKQYDVSIIIGDLSDGVVFRALGKISLQPMKRNEDLAEILHNLQITSSIAEITIPVSARLLKAKFLLYPIIHMQGVFLLNADYVEQLYNCILKDHLIQYTKESTFQKVFNVQTNGRTKQIIDELSVYCNSVNIVENEGFLTVTVSSESFNNLVLCETKLKMKLKSAIIGSYGISNDPDSIYSNPNYHVRQAINDIEKCLTQYGPENVFLSFNGGKDCTVLLHLLHITLRKKYPNYNKPIFCLYVTSKNPFPEQDEFVSQCQLFYNLNVVTISSGIKDALKNVLVANSNFKACFMGTRRTDPFSEKLHTFQMTDSDWPKIMRVSPLLDWHYSDIWDYILYYKVPYCKLYDLGFTSLGNAVNTKRNPSLHFPTESETYLPAYKLLNEAKERNGRSSI